MTDSEVIADGQPFYYTLFLSYLGEEDGVVEWVDVAAGDGLVVGDLILEEDDELVLGFYVYGYQLQKTRFGYYCD